MLAAHSIGKSIGQRGNSNTRPTDVVTPSLTQEVVLTWLARLSLNAALSSVLFHGVFSGLCPSSL